jgi:hypothetical protein
MMRWLNPGALAGLVLLAGPVLVHLLLRHRARRIDFPSLRFVRASRTAAARFRLPSDTLLLLLRLAIIGLAVVSLAQPLLLTRSRITTWNGRMAKAVIVDASGSMAPLAAEAAAAASGEFQPPALVARIDAGNLRTGIVRGAARLATMAPARREIVVISDFQWGALQPTDLDGVPAEMGIRFVQLGATQSARSVRGIDLLTSEGSARQNIQLSTDATRVLSVVTQPASGGLELLTGPADVEAARRLHRAVAAAGAAAPSARQRITVVFAGAPLPTVHALSTGWMLETVLRLGDDREILEACAETSAVATGSSDDRWYRLFEDAEGRPLVRAAAREDGLIVAIAAGPSTFVAAAVVRGLLDARAGTTAHPEQEVRRMSSAELASLTRPSAPVTKNVQVPGVVSDARWCWGVILALLAIEAFVRRGHRDATVEARADAA